MKHLLLLHGAIGSNKELEPLANTLAAHFHVHTINFSGHGGQEIINDFSIKSFAEEVLQWMAEHSLNKVNIFGYSMGGYVAIYLALYYPGSIESVVTLGTKYQWDKEVAAKEVAMLRPDIIQVKVPGFAEELKQRHSPVNWKEVLTQTAGMLIKMGENPPLTIEDFSQVSAKILLLLGDHDKMVTLKETVDVFNKLPSAKLGILPGTPHPIGQVNLPLLSLLITGFLLEQ